MSELVNDKPEAQSYYGMGYKQALLDMAERLNNAHTNGYNTLEWTELMDQLAELGDDLNGCAIVSHDELLKAGM